MNVGDEIEYEIDGKFPGRGYVIGSMLYDSRVVCVANGKATGMPINARHCRVISSGHSALALRMRQRYQDLYGERFNSIE